MGGLGMVSHSVCLLLPCEILPKRSPSCEVVMGSKPLSLFRLGVWCSLEGLRWKTCWNLGF